CSTASTGSSSSAPARPRSSSSGSSRRENRRWRHPTGGGDFITTSPSGQSRFLMTAAPSRTPSTVQPARRIAYDVLSAVSTDDAYANLLLPTLIARASLNTADAGLATELTYGTLRLRGYYDRVIALAAGRDIREIDPAILDVLRLGDHQLDRKSVV